MQSDRGGIVARSAGRRLLWLGVGLVAPLFGVVAAFGTVRDTQEPVALHDILEVLALDPAPLGDAGTIIYFREERIQNGDNAAKLLARLGADPSEATEFSRSPRAVRAFRLLRPGMTVRAKIDDGGKLRSLAFLTGHDTIVSIDRLGSSFVTFEDRVEGAREIEMRSGKIATSLFAATDAAGIPDNVATQVADIFSGEIDFHRDLRPGDRFAVVFESLHHGGQPIRSGRVLAAEFATQKKTYRAVWFQDPWGTGGYYTPEGSNLRKAFLRSPLEFSRVTSGFGMRRHPVLQHWRAHQGVDYGAPVGTRVRATGDGVVVFAGFRNGYGNLVVLKHHGGYSTYYAHLRSFARSLRSGARVAQGEVVGYVGQTGWATGPHLHYEFHAHNQNRNPLTMVFPAARPIPAPELPGFRRMAEPLAARLDLLRNGDATLFE